MPISATVGSWVWIAGSGRWALIVSIVSPVNWNYVIPDPGAVVTNSVQDLNAMQDEFFAPAGPQPEGTPSGGGG